MVCAAPPSPLFTLFFRSKPTTNSFTNLDAVLEAVKLPAAVTGLDTGLAKVTVVVGDRGRCNVVSFVFKIGCKGVKLTKLKKCGI